MCCALEFRGDFDTVGHMVVVLDTVVVAPLQPAVMEELVQAAAKEGTTVSDFVNTTLSEKLAALRMLELLQERAVRGDRSAFRRILASSQGNDPPREGDEVPDDM